MRRGRPRGSAPGGASATPSLVSSASILLAERYLPERLQQGAETAVAALVVFLAVRLLVRWRHGYFDLHAHPHPEQAHRHGVGRPSVRSASGSCTGSAGAPAWESCSWQRSRRRRWPSRRSSLAAFTAVSMAVVTAGFGQALSSRPFAAASTVTIPALGAASLLFGVWYAAAAWSLAPYPF